MTQCFTQGRIGATLTGLCGGDASDLVCECPPSEIEFGSIFMHDSSWEVNNVSRGRIQSAQHRRASKSRLEVGSMTEPESNVSNDNVIPTTALRFDNSLGWCQHRHANADRK